MKNRLKKALAFTITELVIVIAVIAILAAVLIPTFSHVIDESKKSHDTQYMREINTAIANYAAQHGLTYPKDYQELMLALDDMGLCDDNNPFLLATELRQDNVFLIWYPNSDKVELLDTSTQSYQPVTNEGYGNLIQVGNRTASSGEVMSSDLAYILCNTGDKDSMSAAEVYRRLFIIAGGSVRDFFAGNNSIEDLVGDMENRSWANSIVGSLKNAQQGYTYDQGIADGIVGSLASSDSANVDLTEMLSPEDKNKLQNNSAKFEDLSDNGQISIQQGVRGTLATLASLENNPATKNELSGKNVELNVPEGTTVDMKDVVFTPMGNSYRKEPEVDKGTPQSTVSVDFDDVTLENLTIEENQYVSTGAEFQDEGDSGHSGGGYAFTYGLFGTVIAEPGEKVTIENLNLKNVSLDFSGAKKDGAGQEINTFSDNAGVVVGYAQGNVELKNITVDGADADGNPGLIKGYDAVSGVIGRAYGAKDAGSNVSSSLVLDNVHVKNMKIQGERRAAGFVGFVSKKMDDVTIKNSSLENVEVYCERNDGGTSIYQCWAMALIMGQSGQTITITDNTLINVKTGVRYFQSHLKQIDEQDTDPSQKAPNGTLNTWHAIGTKVYVCVKNPIYTDELNEWLLLVANSSAKFSGNQVIQKDKDGTTQKTWNIPDNVGDTTTTTGSDWSLVSVS